MNHVHGVVHCKSLENSQGHKEGSALSTGKRGCPSRPSTSDSHSIQSGLHSFFKHSEGESHSYDNTSISARTCWGLRGPCCMYAGKSYPIDPLLFDPHPGKNWYPEPYLEAFFTVESDLVLVKGSFRHRSCRLFPHLILDFLTSHVTCVKELLTNLIFGYVWYVRNVR